MRQAILAQASDIRTPERNQILSRLRGSLWISLPVVTLLLLLYPKHFALEIVPIQSMRVFPILSLFGAVFYIWFAAIMSLTVLPKPCGGALVHSEGIILASMFSLGYRGIWDVAIPDSVADGLSNIITTHFIVDTGTLSKSNLNIAYLDFPGLHVLTALLTSVAQSNIQTSVVIILILLDVLLAALVYLIAVYVLRDVRLAVLAALLAMLGNPLFATFFFYPGYLGLILVSAFLLAVIKDETARPTLVLSIALLMGATMSHFVSSMAFFFVLVGISGMNRVLHHRRMSSVAVLFAMVPAAWIIHAAASTFSNLAVIVPRIVRNLAEDPFFWLATVGRANLGGDKPLWASMVWLLWFTVLYGLGTAAAFIHLLKVRKTEFPVQMALGALSGLVILSVIAFLVSPGGDQFIRFLIFAPLLTAAFLVKTCWQMLRGRRFALGGLFLVGLLLSFPTFLVYRSSVEMYSFYPHEYAAGRFVSRATLDEKPVIYNLGASRMPILRYKPDGTYVDEGSVVDESHFRRRISEVEESFRTETLQGRPTLFLYSARPKVYYQHILGIEPMDEVWLQLQRDLSNADLIYDSYDVQFYFRRAN